jgi:hypothetical protein
MTVEAGSRISWRKGISLVLAIALLVVLLLTYYGNQNNNSDGTSTPVRFIDQTGTMPTGYVSRMNDLLRGLFMETGVDMRFLIVNSLNGQSLLSYAVTQARKRGIGANSDERGLLCVYDLRDMRMRIEVGPKLEGVLTDAFIGYLERENLHAYVSAKDLQTGLRFTERLVLWRLRTAELGMAYDPRPAKLITNHLLLAEGAGATEGMSTNSPGDGLINRKANAEIKREYGPQPTVENAWEKYQQWLLEPYLYIDVPLFTESTQRMLAHMGLSRAYIHAIFLEEHGQPHKVKVVDDVAMLYFTHTPLTSPYYFRHTENGWVMDIVGAIRNSQEMIGASFTWCWRNGGDAYAKAFSPYTAKIDGVMRLRDGDNQRLPVHDGFFNRYLKNAG